MVSKNENLGLPRSIIQCLQSGIASNRMAYRSSAFVRQHGDVVHWLRIEGIVAELYDVVVLPDVVRPMALGFKTDEIRRSISVGDEVAF